MLVQNRDELLSRGEGPGREVALGIVEAGLAAVDIYNNVRKLVRLDGNTLRIGGQPDMEVSGYGDEEIDLSQVEHIYVVGAGKAVQRQAKALEDILGDRLTAGEVTVKHGEGCQLDRIVVTEGAHPVPDEGSMEGARRILALAKRATERDLVFTVFSSGSSSLFPLPTEGFGIEDVRQVYKLAIKYGSQALIWRVMKYICAVSNGRITAAIHPARMVHFVQSIGLYERWNGVFPEDGNWIPNWPAARRNMAKNVASMQAEPWWDELTPPVRAALASLDPSLDEPPIDDFRQMRMSYWQAMHHRQMLEAARDAANAAGLRGVILGTFHGTTSVDLAHTVGDIAQECARYGEPFATPVALISGGEVANPVGNATGVGGRNQQFALALAAHLRRVAPGRRIVAVAVDSDGTDGPGWQLANAPADTPYPCLAGGLVDAGTPARAKALGIDLGAELKNFNASPVLLKLGAGVYTGNTGTCAGDLRVVLVL